jgi:hypothetical protein
VDNVVSNAIATELDSYRKDLIADGWIVTVTNAPRHKDLSFLTLNFTNYWAYAVPSNRINGEFLKQYITNWYDLAPNDTNVVVLIGHVTIPHSGYRPQDGHGDHAGAWPADLWYADRTGIWTDTNTLGGISPFTYNYPNDGRWDQDWMPPEADGSPGRPEMAIGRIDFRMMRPYQSIGENISDTQDDTEIRLLKRYLDKIARFRRGQIPYQDDFAAFVRDNLFMKLTQSTMRLQSRAWKSEITHPARYYDDLFQAGAAKLFGLHGSYGNYDVFGNVSYDLDRLHSVDQIAQEIASHVPRTMFQVFTGSYFGEWFNGANYINSQGQQANYQGRDALRVVIGVPNSSLTATWMDVVPPYSTNGFVWRMDRFLMGAHYGTALQDSLSVYTNASCRHTVILGDPLLRAHPLPPLSGLASSKSGAVVTLNWPLNTNATAGYRILRADAINAAAWQLLDEVPAGSTSWTYTAANPSINFYLVKAQALKTVGEGAYTNTSLGTFTSIISIP